MYSVEFSKKQCSWWYCSHGHQAVLPVGGPARQTGSKLFGNIYIIQDPEAGQHGCISYKSIGSQKKLGIQLYTAYRVFLCS